MSVEKKNNDSIYKKLHTIMNNISGEFNTDINLILSTINFELYSNNLVSTIHSELTEIKQIEDPNGHIEMLMIVEMENTLTDIETEETITITSIGSGSTATKAQTNALINGYLLSFCDKALTTIN